MKYTINGYSQEKLVELGIDLESSLILRVVADLYTSNSKKLEYKITHEDKYVWCTYKYIHKQIPIIGSEKTMIRKIDSLIEKGILKKVLLKEKNGKKGNYLYISLGENYSDLTEYSEEDIEDDGIDKMSTPLGTKCPEGIDKMSTPLGTKCPNKDSSIYNPSIVDLKEREKENESQKSKSEEKKANEASNPGAYYQTVRMLLACFPSIVPETVSKLGKPIERIKEVIAFAKKYNKGEGWIFSAIKYDYSLDNSYFDRQAEKKEKIQAWKDKKTEEEKKWEEKLFDFV